jgi:hypothetical protein
MRIYVNSIEHYPDLTLFVSALNVRRRYTRTLQFGTPLVRCRLIKFLRRGRMGIAVNQFEYLPEATEI